MFLITLVFHRLIQWWIGCQNDHFQLEKLNYWFTSNLKPEYIGLQKKESIADGVLWLPSLVGWDVQWGASFHIVRRSFVDMVLQGNVIY